MRVALVEAVADAELKEVASVAAAAFSPCDGCRLPAYRFPAYQLPAWKISTRSRVPCIPATRDEMLQQQLPPRLSCSAFPRQTQKR